MLNIENLSVYYGDMMALSRVDIDIENGEIVALVGSNGAGKTTLINTISGLIRPKTGSIKFQNISIERAQPHAIVQAGLVQIPEGRRLFPDMTVLENLELGAYTKQARKALQTTLEYVFSLFPYITQRKNQIVATLSGGEQQMLAIARGLMALPALLILDEPSLGLAPIVVQTIFKTIHEIRSKGLTVFLVEQNVRQALLLSNRGFVLENGKITLSGEGPQLLKDDHVREAYLGI
jgi:branched-chain amino acid transport system ATP-binding protein